MNIENLRTKIKNLEKEYYIVNIGIIILGLLLIIFPDKLIDIVCRSIGIVLAVWGGFRIWDFIRNKATTYKLIFSLLQGCLLLGTGLFFILRPDVLAGLIISVCAFILLIGAVIKLRHGIEYGSINPTMRWLQTAGSVLMIVLGVIALANPFGTASVLLIFLGISLIIDGLWDLISTIIISKYMQKIGNDITSPVNSPEPYRQKMVDAEYEDN